MEKSFFLFFEFCTSTAVRSAVATVECRVFIFPIACILFIFHFCWHAIGLATVMLTMMARVIHVSAGRSTTSARPRRRPIGWLCCIFLSIIAYTQAYHRAPCKKIAVKYQFQFRCVVSLAITFMFDDFADMCSHMICSSSFATQRVLRAQYQPRPLPQRSLLCHGT